MYRRAQLLCYLQASVKECCFTDFYFYFFYLRTISVAAIKKMKKICGEFFVCVVFYRIQNTVFTPLLEITVSARTSKAQKSNNKQTNKNHIITMCKNYTESVIRYMGHSPENWTKEGATFLMK